MTTKLMLDPAKGVRVVVHSEQHRLGCRGFFYTREVLTFVH
jgi:hypothetical protein